MTTDPITNKAGLKVYVIFYPEEFENQPYSDQVVNKFKCVFQEISDDFYIMDSLANESNLKIQSFVCTPQIFSAGKDIKTSPRSSKVVNLKTSLNSLIHMCATELVKEITNDAEEQVRNSLCPDLRNHYAPYATLTDMLLCESVYCFVVKPVSKHKKIDLFEGECPVRTLEKKLWDENHVALFDDFSSEPDGPGLRFKKYRGIRENIRKTPITGGAFKYM